MTDPMANDRRFLEELARQRDVNPATEPTPVEIGQEIGIDPEAVAQIVQRLANRYLIERGRTPARAGEGWDDRRIVLTPEGYRLISRGLG